MTPTAIALISVGGFFAGAVNAIAGGGSFFSFPALLAVGLPPVVANASNSVALWPGSLTSAWAYRRELAHYRRYLVPMATVSLVGGIAGGLLLLVGGDARFSALIPWLLVFATVLFAISPNLSAWLKRLRQPEPERGDSALASAGSPVGWLAQTLVSIYGGFFGAGVGILMMGSLAIGGHEDVQHINALKNLLAAVIYSATVVTFVAAGALSWPHVAVMLVAASLGGYLGGQVARQVNGAWLRCMVIAVGTLLSIYYFWQAA